MALCNILWALPGLRFLRKCLPLIGLLPLLKLVAVTLILLAVLTEGWIRTVVAIVLLRLRLDASRLILWPILLGPATFRRRRLPSPAVVLLLSLHARWKESLLNLLALWDVRQRLICRRCGFAKARNHLSRSFDPRRYHLPASI